MTRAARSILLAGCAYAGLGLPTAAAAQQAAPAVAAAAPAASNEGRIEEIVVTANKRVESANKVGLTITALSGAQLSERRVTSLQDIAAAVPGLNYAQSGTATPIFTMRGVGFNETTLGVYPAVSVYVDEVPLPFPVMTLHAAYDLERVEALKGPQGTLFGQNSTGGAVNFIAAKPTQALDIGGDVSYGRFNQVEGNFHVSGPLSDTLTSRLSVTGLRADGWQQSYTRPGDTNGKLSYFAGRLLTNWAPSDTIRFSLNLNAWNDKSEPQAPQLLGVRPQIPGSVKPVVLNYPFAPLTVRAADWSIGKYTPSSDRTLYQAALRTEIDLTDNITLTSLTSYNHFKQKLSSDQDGMAPLIANLSPSDGTIRSFNQELRLASTSKSSALRWVVGANYEKSRTFESQTLNFGDGSSSVAFFGINTTGSENLAHIRNIAVFGNAEYDILPDLTLKAGARYTDSRNNTEMCGTANGDGLVAGLFNFLGTVLGSVPFTPITTGDCYVLNDNLVPGDTFFSTLEEDNVSWRAGVDYRANANTLLYVNVSRGYKAGSYPTLSASTFLQYKPVTQESVTSYEAGLKAGLWDRKVQLNAAAFYYDYKNKQVRGKIPDPVFDVLDTLVNVPKSRVYGAEADLTVKPMQELTLQATLTYLNSQVKSYSGPTVYGNIVDFAGGPLPFTPEWSYAVNADYRAEISGGGKPFVGVGVRGQSASVATLGGNDVIFPTGPSYRIVPGITKPFILPGYATVDARLGFEAANGHWTAMLWAKNVFNKLYYTNSNHFLDVTTRFVGLPATYGVTLSFRN